MGPLYHGKRALSTYLRYINKLASWLPHFWAEFYCRLADIDGVMAAMAVT